MLKLKYTLTPILLNNLNQIERFYGQLEAMRLPQKLELNLKRDNLVQSTYASNKIEGNPLSFHEVTNLLLDERVPVNRNEKEVALYYDLLQKLDAFKETEFSTDLVTKLHHDLFAGIHEYAGQIRNEVVAVGKYMGEKGNVSFRVKHLPPFHNSSEITAALKELLDYLNREKEIPVAIKAGIFHHQFLYIHPFEDGNGRVCRIMTALLFIKGGYRINKYFILDDYYDIDRILYSDKLHTADEGDKTIWLEYFTGGVKHSLQSALARAENALRTLSMNERPTRKEKEVLELMRGQPEITSTEIAQLLKVSRQQAHNLLSALVEKGLLERVGSTKSSYYRLK